VFLALIHEQFTEKKHWKFGHFNIHCKISLYPSNSFTNNHNQNSNNTDISSSGEDWDSQSIMFNILQMEKFQFVMINWFTLSSFNKITMWQQILLKIPNMKAYRNLQSPWRAEKTRRNDKTNSHFLPRRHAYTELLCRRLGKAARKSLNKILYDSNTNYMHKCL
jgi:hypothetical protein